MGIGEIEPGPISSELLRSGEKAWHQAGPVRRVPLDPDKEDEALAALKAGPVAASETREPCRVYLPRRVWTTETCENAA
jgi:hypothetical protein